MPVFPTGRKYFEIRCGNCGDETLSESILKEYVNRARTPFYLYSALILAVAIAAFWFYWNSNTQKQKIVFAGNPMVGDIYTITEEDHGVTRYSFFRIAGISKDSVYALHNTLDYGGFVGNLADDDYFIKDDTVRYSRKTIKAMLDLDEIYSVKRNYGSGSGFNRIK